MVDWLLATLASSYSIQELTLKSAFVRARCLYISSSIFHCFKMPCVVSDLEWWPLGLIITLAMWIRWPSIVWKVPFGLIGELVVEVSGGTVGHDRWCNEGVGDFFVQVFVYNDRGWVSGIATRWCFGR